MPRGGARPNSGPKKGTKYAPTISKEQARDALRQIVLAEMQALTAAQIAHAKGLKYLVTRNAKTGKFERVSKERMEQLLEAGDDALETIEVWDKDPSVQAFTDLMNRALDKPKEQEQEIKLTGEADMIAALTLGRQRVAQRKRQG
jgi:hypothetical protein